MCTPMFIAVLFTIPRFGNTLSDYQHMSGQKKKRYIYIMEYSTAEKKKGSLPFATVWIELKTIMLSEISQIMKDKYHVMSLITGI